MSKQKQQAAPPPKPDEKLSRIRQRQKLIEACITALHQHGPSRTTIEKVTAIAEMSPGIVNFYFETKAALLIAALDHLAAEFEERVIAPLSAMRETPVLALERLVDLYLDPDIASPRKVSVWYAFWGEASARGEYYAICGKRDQDFADLVRDLVARLIDRIQAPHLDADALSLGLIGALEIIWQQIAFQEHADLDRAAARGRCLAYLRSVFPASFALRSAVGETPARLPGRSYNNPAVFAAEAQALFRQNWQFLAHDQDLPEPRDYVTLNIAGERIFAVRDNTGLVRAFRNVCLKRPHELALGMAGQFGGMIRCAVDGAVYALDGRPDPRAGVGALLPIASASMGDMIWVLAGAKAAAWPPAGLDGLAWPDLRPAGGMLTDIAADWKVVVEHWADAYLGGTILPRAPAVAEGGWAMRPIDGGLFARIALGGGAGSWAACHTAALASGLAAPAWERRLLWPNLLIESRPDGATLQKVLPNGPGSSTIRTRHYVLSAAGRAERALSYLAIRLHRHWQAEDRAIMSSTQIGLTAPGTPPIGEAEGAQAAFWRWLRQTLPGSYDTQRGG